MKRDAIILIAATCVLTILAYNGRYTEKADLSTIQAINTTGAVVETEAIDVTEIAAEAEVLETTEIVVEEIVEGTETVSTGFVMYSSIWDKVQMTFYKDGTCVFEMPGYDVTEQCTWSYEEGILSVTREDGKTFSSYTDEDRATLKLDYEAMANERLIGQFDSSDYKDFFEAE